MQKTVDWSDPDPHGEEKYNSSEIEKRGLKESEIVYPVQERVFCSQMQANEIWCSLWISTTQSVIFILLLNRIMCVLVTF